MLESRSTSHDKSYANTKSSKLHLGRGQGWPHLSIDRQDLNEYITIYGLPNE